MNNNSQKIIIVIIGMIVFISLTISGIIALIKDGVL